jgi:hypothetical protein
MSPGSASRANGARTWNLVGAADPIRLAVVGFRHVLYPVDGEPADPAMFVTAIPAFA